MPGAVLTYDVRHNESSTAPVLMMIGSPMGASGFGTLACHFTDWTVVTCDPRGVERGPKDDPAFDPGPAIREDMVVMVTDPVCGMRIDAEDAVATVEHEGETYSFCSQACHDAFVADPDAYLD